MDMLRRFVYFVNILDPSLKFTVEIGGKVLKFLDLLISIRNGRLETTQYTVNQQMATYTCTMTLVIHGQLKLGLRKVLHFD